MSEWQIPPDRFLMIHCPELGVPRSRPMNSLDHHSILCNLRTFAADKRCTCGAPATKGLDHLRSKPPEHLTGVVPRSSYEMDMNAKDDELATLRTQLAALKEEVRALMSARLRYLAAPCESEEESIAGIEFDKLIDAIAARAATDAVVPGLKPKCSTCHGTGEVCSHCERASDRCTCNEGDASGDFEPCKECVVPGLGGGE